MNSSSDIAWAPGLDLSARGLTRIDPARIEQAVAEGYEAGYREGLARGHADGQAAALAGAAEELDQLRAATSTVLARLGALGEHLAHSENVTADLFRDRAADAAVRIARAVLDRELADETEAAMDAVRRALTSLDRGTAVRVQLHPDDLALLADAEFPDNVRLDPNPGLRRGDATARTDDRNVDARIEAALERARDALEGNA